MAKRPQDTDFEKIDTGRINENFKIGDLGRVSNHRITGRDSDSGRIPNGDDEESNNDSDD